MSLLPRSHAARRRLLALATAAPVLAIATTLALWGLRGSISYFYTPAQALKAHVPAGRAIQLGGLVESGSVAHRTGGEIDFVIRDRIAASRVVYRGEPPDLFREGQGVVASGSFDKTGVFEATQLLAKHDERYMPRALAQALKTNGEWRGATGRPRSPQ